jgi:hypothetical protein
MSTECTAIRPSSHSKCTTHTVLFKTPEVKKTNIWINAYEFGWYSWYVAQVLSQNKGSLHDMSPKLVWQSLVLGQKEPSAVYQHTLSVSPPVRSSSSQQIMHLYTVNDVSRTLQDTVAITCTWAASRTALLHQTHAVPLGMQWRPGSCYQFQPTPWEGTGFGSPFIVSYLPICQVYPSYQKKQYFNRLQSNYVYNLIHSKTLAPNEMA